MPEADEPFREGEPVWVMQADGSQRPGEWVGIREESAWFGGAPMAIVVHPETRSAETVEIDRVIARDA